MKTQYNDIHNVLIKKKFKKCVFIVIVEEKPLGILRSLYRKSNANIMRVTPFFAIFKEQFIAEQSYTCTRFYYYIILTRRFIDFSTQYNSRAL